VPKAKFRVEPLAPDTCPKGRLNKKGGGVVVQSLHKYLFILTYYMALKYFLTIFLFGLLLVLIISDQLSFGSEVKTFALLISGIILLYPLSREMYDVLLIFTRKKSSAKRILLLLALPLFIALLAILTGSWVLILVAGITSLLMLSVLLSFFDPSNPYGWVRLLKTVFSYDKISRKEVEKYISGIYGMHFTDFVFDCPFGGEMATALANFTDQKTYLSLTIYWHRKDFETEYQVELKRPTKTILRIQKKKRIDPYALVLGVQEAKTRDNRFDKKFTILTNRPEYVDSLSERFKQLMIKGNYDSFILEGNKIIFTEDGLQENLKTALDTLFEFQEHGKTLAF